MEQCLYQSKAQFIDLQVLWFILYVTLHTQLSQSSLLSP